jgi:hypothetical protein
MTSERGPAAAVVERWQQQLKDLQMGSDGLFQVELHCLRCNKLLNADGNHPAEVHAGACNGLCYACTAAGPYVEKIAVLDGARSVNYPPHCPSWRRDREHFTGYLDCPGCKGSGVQGWGTSVGGGRYRHYCEACHGRYYGHPLRAKYSAYTRTLMERAQEVYTRRLKAALGLRPRCSYKAYQAALATIDLGVRDGIKADIQSRYYSLRALHERRAERSQAWAWRAPTPEEVTSV